MQNAQYGGVDGANAALVLALGVGIAALTASGGGPVTRRRLLSGVLSNPVPAERGQTPWAPGDLRAVRTALQATAHRQAAA